SFLVFDGDLSEVSAYEATLILAYDTTFDLDGDLICVWMDQNYNWSNPTFGNRCGESLNLAVNLIADVLNTFCLEVSEHIINVPFHYQEINYYCGPAALQMVFDFYGENIRQFEIADAARTNSEIYATFTDELRRAGHFSNLSISLGDEMPGSITGYTLRGLGYAAFETYDMDLTKLKSFIDQDTPLILLMWDSTQHKWGHYRVATGYNETHVFLHDPWKKYIWGGRYGGPNNAINNTEFLELWSYSGNWALYVSLWIIDVSAPTFMEPGTPFQINATTTYPQPLPNALNNYPASSCNATIMLPANLSLAEGEIQKKTLSTGFLEAGANSTTSWMLVANSSAPCTISIEVEGMISGSVGGEPPYEYIDRIGAVANFTLFEMEKEDKNAPFIGIPSRIPEGDVQPSQEVEVSAYVTDIESGIENVTLFYAINNGTSWENVTMNYNQLTTLYEAIIPGQPIGTTVKFEIIAFDYVGNNATKDGTEPYYTYQVIPEFPTSLILPLLMVLITSIIIYVKKRALNHKNDG
ncbi:MAG: C39 family peptidase, partial [Candidatus Bathyarchaeota archaeon]|nr:C39 family peptidase [Candidatus Bathyarchaeota archaeon]